MFNDRKSNLFTLMPIALMNKYYVLMFFVSKELFVFETVPGHFVHCQLFGMKIIIEICITIKLISSTM